MLEELEEKNMYNLENNKKEKLMSMSADDLVKNFSTRIKPKKRILIVILTLILIIAIIKISPLNKIIISDLGDMERISFAENSIAATSSKTSVLTIPSGIVKANPFLPYRTLGDEPVDTKLINDVPKYDLIAPPEVLGENMSALKVMDTVVSGILFDKYSPSAILNIEGTDYLVKKGDTVNNYKVLAIARDSVTVQFGKNTYKAGIGEILTDGKINHNEVSNLSKKFGGEQR